MCPEFDLDLDLEYSPKNEDVFRSSISISISISSRALKTGMCSRVNQVSIFAWTESPPQRGQSPHFRVDQVRFSVRIGKLTNLSKIVSVLLSASVERVGVSRMRDFFQYRCYYPHRSRDTLSPVSGIIFLSISINTFQFIKVKFLVQPSPAHSGPFASPLISC